MDWRSWETVCCVAAIVFSPAEYELSKLPKGNESVSYVWDPSPSHPSVPGVDSKFHLVPGELHVHLVINEPW